MKSPLDWTHLATDIPSQGLACDRVATEKERAAIAAGLDLLSLDELSAKYRIQAVADGGYRLTGSLVAKVVQACVVSVEPIASELKEPVEAEFRAAPRQQSDTGEQSVLEGSDVEVMEQGRIEAGRIIFETLSGALDPYPRKEGASFGWRDPAEQNPEKISPFAVLSKLKDKK
jgi:uncharacterized metal-binding protein YceD (DUF177 family)